MKRLVVPILLAASTLAPAFAQPGALPAEPGAPKNVPLSQETPIERAAEPPADMNEGKLEYWKWANFLVLAGALGYLAYKNAGPFYAGRSKQIRKDLLEAEEARRQAELRAAEVDRRLASLEAEIAAMRAESDREAEAEADRLASHAAGEIAKIRAHAQQEIEAAGKAARTELKRYSAQLAIQLAEQRIRERMTPAAQEGLVRGFVRELEPPASSATT